MPGPDWLQFKHAMEVNRSDLIHSPKGTKWKKHKYVKIVNGRYYYTSEENMNKAIDAKKKLRENKKQAESIMPKVMDEVYNEYKSLHGDADIFDYREIQRKYPGIDFSTSYDEKVRKFENENKYFRDNMNKYAGKEQYNYLIPHGPYKKLNDLRGERNTYKAEISKAMKKSSYEKVRDKVLDKVEDLYDSGKKAIDNLLKKFKK